MLRNNGLQGDEPDLTAWRSVGDATIAVDSDNPLTTAITRTLRLDVDKDASGQVGFSNEGYWGIPVDGSEFQSAFWIKGEFSGDITVRLVGNYTGTEYASKTFSQESKADEFTKATVKFPTEKAPDGAVLYEVTVDGSAVQGSSLYFGFVELFPETYKSRCVSPSWSRGEANCVGQTGCDLSWPSLWRPSRALSFVSRVVTTCEYHDLRLGAN